MEPSAPGDGRGRFGGAADVRAEKISSSMYAMAACREAPVFWEIWSAWLLHVAHRVSVRLLSGTFSVLGESLREL